MTEDGIKSSPHWAAALAVFADHDSDYHLGRCQFAARNIKILPRMRPFSQQYGKFKQCRMYLIDFAHPGSLNT